MRLRETRDSLGQRVDAAHFADETTVITKNGTPRAALISFETYQLLRGAAGADVGQTSADSHSTPLHEVAADTPVDQAKPHHATPRDTD